jgi:hypothetical protein
MAAIFVRFSRFSHIVPTGPVVCAGTGKEYTSITARRNVHHPVDFGEYQYPEGKLNSHQRSGKILRLLTMKTGIIMRNPSGEIISTQHDIWHQISGTRRFVAGMIQ